MALSDEIIPEIPDPFAPRVSAKTELATIGFLVAVGLYALAGGCGSRQNCTPCQYTAPGYPSNVPPEKFAYDVIRYTLDKK